MPATNSQTQTFSGLERIYKILTILILFFGFLFGIFFFNRLLFPSLYFLTLIGGGIFILAFYLGIAPLVSFEKRLETKIIFDIIFFFLIQIFSSFSYFALFYFLPIIIGGVVFKKQISALVSLGSLAAFALSQYIIYQQSGKWPSFEGVIFVSLILVLVGVLSLFLEKEIPEKESEEEEVGFIVKAQARKRLEFIKRVGIVMEIFSWVVFSICFFVYFFTTLKIAESLAFLGIWVLSGIHAFFFHRIIYPFLVEKNKELIFKIDSILFLAILLLIFQLAGVMVSPLIILLPTLIFGSAVLLGREFPFIILAESIIVFLFYSYTVDSSQLSFFFKNPFLGGGLVLILVLISILAYFFANRYWEVVQEKEKIFKVASGLIADKRKIEAILESMGDGVFVTDAKKRLILVNNAAQRLARLSKKKVLGRFYGDVFRFYVQEETLNPLNYEVDCPVQLAISERRSIVRDDLILITEGGKRINVSLYAAPVIDASENIIGGIVVLRDVTREKEIEKMKFEFISIASHELKTPIALIAGHLSMALEEKFGKMDEKIKELVTKAYEGAQRLQKLINDLLSVSRIEEGRMTLALEKIDIEDLIKEVIAEFQGKAKEKNLYIKYQKLSSRLPMVEVDKIKIREVISNLLSNALKFTYKGGVTIKTKAQGKFLEVRVEDTGIGINKEDIPYLFQKFHQIENPYTRKEQGTGLGLYICKSIVEMHGGKIWVESEGEGKGSTFIFTLPVKKD